MSDLFKSDESGLLLVFMNPGPTVSLEEFHEWYDNEHVPLRINRFSTFRSAVRYSVSSTTYSSQIQSEKGPESEWGAFYTVSSNSTFSDPSYTSLRSERSERETELFTRLAIVDRRIYRLEYDSDSDPNISKGGKKVGLGVQKASDTGKYLVTNSVDMKQGWEEEYNKWFEQEHVPMLSQVSGWKRSRRFTLIDNGVNGTAAQPQLAEAIPRTLGLHEYEEQGIEQTQEYKAACSTEWREKVIGKNGENVIRRERKTCTLYKAWDPIAAINNEGKEGK